MGWFKKLTGIDSKPLVQAAGAATGAYFGGPQGASVGYNLGSAVTGDTSALGNIVQGAVGLGTDYLQSQLKLDQQKELAVYTAARQNELNEAAFQRNLQQWNLENAYNTPAAQMQRFAEAGLNPNLIYGQQNLSAGSPELKPATYNPGEYQPVDHSAQRQALKLAMLEHAQRIENQAIQNDLARQELALRIKASEREDEKLKLLKSRAVNLTDSSNPVKDEYDELRNEKLRRELELWQPTGNSLYDSTARFVRDNVSDIIGFLTDEHLKNKKLNRQYEWHTTSGNGNNVRTFGRRIR